MSAVLKYGATAKWLHWLIAFMVIIMLIFGPGLEDMVITEREQIIMGHAGLGTLVLILMLIRWPWRLTHAVPGPTDAMSAMQDKLAVAMHWALNLLLVLQPIFGVAQAMFLTDYEVLAFGVIPYSSFAADNADMARIFHIAHSINGKLLTLLVLGHFFAALYHHFWQKDDVLRRMLPFGKVDGDGQKTG